MLGSGLVTARKTRVVGMVWYQKLPLFDDQVGPTSEGGLVQPYISTLVVRTMTSQGCIFLAKNTPLPLLQCYQNLPLLDEQLGRCVHSAACVVWGGRFPGSVLILCRLVSDPQHPATDDAGAAAAAAAVLVLSRTLRQRCAPSAACAA
jgi:hypothetical protein